jgi:hypothetical protein
MVAPARVFVSRPIDGDREQQKPTSEEFAMPQTVSDLATLQQYLDGVVGRANHHARNVDEVALTIAGAIAWRTDGDLIVRTYAGTMANVMRVRINGRQYTLAYNHTTGAIEVREGKLTGQVFRSFTNANTAREVKDFFGSL